MCSKGLDILDRFFTICAKRHNVCDFLFAILHAKPLFGKKSSLKGKKLLKETIFFLNSSLLEYTRLSEGDKNGFDSYLPKKCII